MVDSLGKLSRLRFVPDELELEEAARPEKCLRPCDSLCITGLFLRGNGSTEALLSDESAKPQNSLMKDHHTDLQRYSRKSHT